MTETEQHALDAAKDLRDLWRSGRFDGIVWTNFMERLCRALDATETKESERMPGIRKVTDIRRLETVTNAQETVA